MITRPFSSESSPVAESSSNFDNTKVDGKKYITQPETDSYSAETKSLAERSAIQTKKITQTQLYKLILQQIFSNNVHYQVEGNVSLGSTDLTALPDNLSVEGNLYLANCKGLTALPDNLCVGDFLCLNFCTGLTALPDNLRVGGYLFLDGCTGLTALPDNLCVGRGLFLTCCTGLTALPENLCVGGGP